MSVSCEPCRACSRAGAAASWAGVGSTLLQQLHTWDWPKSVSLFVLCSGQLTRMGCRKSKWSRIVRQAGLFPNYCQQQESCTSLVGQGNVQAQGQLLVSRKMIYQSPERLEPFLFTEQHRPGGHQGHWLSLLCPGDAGSCESGNKGDNQRETLLRFLSGISSEGWTLQLCVPDQCVTFWVSPFVLCRRL